MDRWNIVTTLNYLSLEREMDIVLAKNKNLNNAKGKEKVSNMIKVASLTRKGFIAINPFLVNEATLIILDTFSLPFALFRFLFLASTISISRSRLK